ncbi:MAG: transglutaminase domain-containing protein [Alicyclobacillaceae bacterium]|nr:transglutaminase domain-containing protein [Alicyclobacillaceae bacterium]
MDQNWITLIAGFLLLSPVLVGFWRGLPSELEWMKYSVRSALGSVQWIAATLAALWILRTIAAENPWNLSQLEWLRRQLNTNLISWAAALPVTAFLISWFLDLFVQPLAGFGVNVLHRLQGWAARLPKGMSRLLGALLQIPRGMLHLLIFVAAVHLVLPYIHAPSVALMAQQSPLYRWADNRVVGPLLSSPLVKRLPVLGEQAGRWFDELSREAAKSSPPAARGFLTWQTRFHSNPEIDALARTLVEGSRTDREKAYRLYKWIGDHIAYDEEKAALIEAGRVQTLSFGAVPTFESRKGVCSDYSSLMVAMGRAVGLRVKQEFGLAVLPDGTGGPHAWNVVYLADEQKWIPCDPTWEQAGNYFDNPDFYATHKPEHQEGP